MRNTGCSYQAKALIPANLRALFNEYFPKTLSHLENDSALPAAWDLMKGRQNREALFHDLLIRAYLANSYARTWHKPLHEMTAAERSEHFRHQRPRLTTNADVTGASHGAIYWQASLKEAADPELAAVLDDAIKANTAAAEMLEARDRAFAKLFSDFQADPREKNLAAWRVWFGCVLCRWFRRSLEQPHGSHAADLANRFFHDCAGVVVPETLLRNYVWP
jgi:hypothetical protein